MSIQNLDSRFPVVNPDGTATEYLMRLLRDRGSAQNETDEALEEVSETLETVVTDVADLETTVANLSLDDLSDVDTSSTPPTSGQALVWDGAQWEPGAVSGGSGLPFSGALVTKTAVQSATSAGVTMTWDSEVYDTNGWHSNVTNNTRLTVPVGVTRARLTAMITRASATDQLFARIQKNGAVTVGLGQQDTDTTGADFVSLASAVIDVVAGDYFEVVVISQVTGNVDTTSWFAIEAVESFNSTMMSGSPWELISTTNIAAAAANFDFTGLADYEDIIFSGINLTTSASTIRLLRVSVDNGSTFYSTSGDYYSVDANGVVTAATAIAAHSTATASSVSFFARFFGFSTAGAYKYVTGDSGNPTRFLNVTTNPLNAIRLTCSSAANITGGVINIYGRKRPTPGAGTSFPIGPTTGQRFFRTDRGIEYYWDGTRWLSTQEFTIDFRNNYALATDVASYHPVPYRGTYGVYLTRFESVIYRDTAAGVWDVKLDRVTAANVTTNIVTQSGASDTTNGQWYEKISNINAVLDSTAYVVQVLYDEISGTGQIYGGATLHYRLIG